MSKTETIEKFKAEYLASKSPEFISQFESKSPDKQYSAIMTWRYRARRRKPEEKPAELPCMEFVSAAFRQMQSKISAAMPRLEDADIAAIQEDAKSFLDFLEDYSRIVRREEIAALEARQREIASRLKELKSLSEPSLFDSLDDQPF